MLCPNCQNMLQKITDTNKLKFLCESCGTEYKATGVDTLIYNEDQQRYSLTKNGRTIWHYPANPKVMKSCQAPRCDQKIVAWENDSQLNKIYGCQCGYSWKEIIQS